MNNIKKASFIIAQRILTRNTSKLLQSFLSLFVSAAVLTIILSLIGSVRTYLLTQSTELLGGDMVINKSVLFTPNDSLSLNQLVEQGAIVATRNQTTVMLTNADKSKSILSSVKIVSTTYPLYGEIKTKAGKPELTERSIIAEQAFIDRMGITVGESVYIGDVEYTLGAILESEPDQFSSNFPLGPKVLISEAAWLRSGINNEETRMQYSILVRIPSELKESPLISQIESEFESIRARVSYAADGPDRLLSILEVTEQFFLTFILLSLFLVMVNIRTNLTFLLHHFLKTIAVLRVLGMTKQGVVTVFVLLLIVISLIAAILGNIVGNNVVHFILPYASDFVSDINLQAPSLLENIGITLLFTISICLFSALPILLKIMAVEPKMILSQTIQHSKTNFLREILASSLTIGALALGMWYLTKNLYATLITIAAVTATFLTFVALIQLLLTVLYKKRFAFPFTVRSIISFTKNQGLVGVSSIASLTLALSILFTLSLVEANITHFLQSQVRVNAPNVYILDIQQDQVEELKQIIPTSLELFSVTRARFIRTDDRYYSRENPNDREFLREFNLTNRSELIEGEKLIAGTWHGNTGKKQVSVEKEFAESAGIRLGSEVELSVQGVPIITQVTSIREVETTQGLPFFYFVFSPDVLEKAPKNYFGYVNIDPKDIPTLQNSISTRFPTISTIPTADIFATVQRVISTLTLAIVVTSLPALVLGMFLVFGMMANIAQERFRNLLLFKVFGSSQKQLFLLYIAESLFSIMFATLFALLFSSIATYLLNRFVFDFNSFIVTPNIIFILLLVILFTFIFATYLIRTMMIKTPNELLREV